MLVGDVILAKGGETETIQPDAPVGEFVTLLMEKHIGAVAVCDAAGGIVGMISERDLVGGLSEVGAGVADILVRDLMTADVVACNSKDKLDDILAMMIEGGFRHMPVIEEGALVGMISMRDVIVHIAG